MHDATEIVFTNHGTAHCSLSGFPDALVLLDAGGRRVTEHPVTLADGGYVTTYANGGVDLAPQTSDGASGADAVVGQAVIVVKTYSMMCGRTSVASVEIVLHDGTSFRVPVAFAPDTNGDCLSGSPVDVSSFQPPGYGPPAHPVPSPDVSVRITAPATAVRGAILDYTVALTNVSGHAFELAPCPAYTESLKALLRATS